MKRAKKKKKNATFILVLLLLIVSIGYALLATNLTINGHYKFSAKWDIHFENLQPSSGNVELSPGDVAASIDQTNKTTINYIVTLNKPGDFYEFIVDVKNSGTIDGMVDSIILKDGNTIITDNNLPNYLIYYASYSDGKAIKEHHLLKAGQTENILVHVEYSKDISVSDLSSVDLTHTYSITINYVQPEWYSGIDRTKEYGNNSYYQLDYFINKARSGEFALDGGVTKVDMGTLGKHYIRLANNTSPEECSTEGFSQTACGIVLEFADIIGNREMNSNSQTNVGGWPASEMRTYVNNNIYNSLPKKLKNAIIDTIVISGHGSTLGETNFTSTDKLYLLSTHEVWEDDDGDPTSGIDYHDSSYNNTRQLDYYRRQNVRTSNPSAAIKQINPRNSSTWWLRSATSVTDTNFFYVTYSTGGCHSNSSKLNTGVSPAFRIAP